MNLTPDDLSLRQNLTYALPIIIGLGLIVFAFVRDMRERRK